MRQQVNAIIAIVIQMCVALFYFGYLGDKYHDILSPEYVGTCYQSREYLEAYISLAIWTVGLAGAISLLMFSFFKSLMPPIFAISLLVVTSIMAILLVRPLAPGSC